MFKYRMHRYVRRMVYIRWINILRKNNLLKTDDSEAKHRFYVSDGAEQFKAFANKILTCHVEEIRDINNIESYM